MKTTIAVLPFALNQKKGFSGRESLKALETAARRNK
jgi:hypothetical protein